MNKKITKTTKNIYEFLIGMPLLNGCVVKDTCETADSVYIQSTTSAFNMNLKDFIEDCRLTEEDTFKKIIEEYPEYGI